jgi:hypothetical protein
MADHPQLAKAKSRDNMGQLTNACRRKAPPASANRNGPRKFHALVAQPSGIEISPHSLDKFLRQLGREEGRLRIRLPLSLPPSFVKRPPSADVCTRQ